jgi:hypothetical protein
MIIDGVLHTLTRALRKPIDAPEVVEAMAIAGFPATRETFDLGDQQRVYYSTPGNAVQFLFEDGALRTIFVATQGDASTDAFERADELIEGLSGTATRAEVRALLGTPEWTSEDPTEEADQFAVDDFFQHFIFVDDRIARITAMSTDPAEW